MHAGHLLPFVPINGLDKVPSRTVGHAQKYLNLKNKTKREFSTTNASSLTTYPCSNTANISVLFPRKYFCVYSDYTYISTISTVHHPYHSYADNLPSFFLPFFLFWGEGDNCPWSLFVFNQNLNKPGLTHDWTRWCHYINWLVFHTTSQPSSKEQIVAPAPEKKNNHQFIGLEKHQNCLHFDFLKGWEFIMILIPTWDETDLDQK